jgi:predicted phage-related endonuclease
MRKLSKNELIRISSELFEAREQRKAAEKIEKEHKATLKEIMGDDETLKAGPFLVVLKQVNKTTLDTKLIKIELGERVSEFERDSSYKTLDIKKVA